MKNFNDVAALRSVLYEKSHSQPEQRVVGLAGLLEQQLDFTRDDAALYASIVLTRNAEGSSDWLDFSAIKVLGTWMRMSQEGMAASLFKSETETWKFSDDLTCEHKLETYEGYVSPLGSSYSAPSSNCEVFIWVSSDLDDQGLKVVIVLPDGGSRVLTFAWLDEQFFPHKCSIDGETFIKQ